MLHADYAIRLSNRRVLLSNTREESIELNSQRDPCYKPFVCRMFAIIMVNAVAIFTDLRREITFCTFPKEFLATSFASCNLDCRRTTVAMEVYILQ